MVFSLSCVSETVSQLVTKCALRFVGRTQGRPLISPTEFEANVTLPDSLFCLLWGASSFSSSSDLGALTVGFSQRLCSACLLVSGQAQLLEELNSSGVSAKGLSDPRVEKSWQPKPWEGSFTSLSIADLGIVLL